MISNPALARAPVEHRLGDAATRRNRRQARQLRARRWATRPWSRTA